MGSGGHHNPIAGVIFGEPMKEAIEVMAADVLDRNQRIAELGNEIERLRAIIKAQRQRIEALEANGPQSSE
jgi:uncharacterized small protein (DUF1192 family)